MSVLPFQSGSDLPVRDRPFNASELERARLLLSTFRDGSGQSVRAGYMPDFLDFERVTAFVCGGTSKENKGIFDVIVPAEPVSKPFGVSCKMAAAQPLTRPCHSWFMEMSNSAKAFHDAFDAENVDWRDSPAKAGPIMVDLVGSWHHAVADEVDVDASKYLLLTHDSRWEVFEIACFDLDLQRADARTEVEWCTEGRNGTISSMAGYIEYGGQRHRLWQFYGNSGGQLKYYPLEGWELWRSSAFHLEEPPVHDLSKKVEEYWPGMWPK